MTKRGMSKKGITHIEAILAITIFLMGVVIIVLLAKPIFFVKDEQSKLTALENEFDKAGSIYYKFYTSIADSECIGDLGMVQNDISPFLVYVDEEAKIPQILEACKEIRGEYTFPYQEKVYVLDSMPQFSGDYNILIGEQSFGATPPAKVSVKAKEINIKILNDNKIGNAKAILRVW